ncbi:MAG: NAD(P)/FAD-dependent oxidoreductase [Candidatus Gracilibacteria bacterium]|jgi:predicted Rossmann fold flavoprotein|nr:NAD(P)/FAD-dependent oxidoreductase [Candidatus Gracilibacteria bacterium]
MQTNILIIGAGASGLMASAQILEKDPKALITIIEKYDQIGKKILITGGGRCNLTNNEKDIKELLKNYPRSKNFLKYALYEFPPEKVMTWFESHGVPLKTEANGRVFPVSNKAKDILQVFEKILANTKISLNSHVQNIERHKEKFLVETFDGEKTTQISTKKLIISCGGKYDVKRQIEEIGYKTAKKFGHAVIEPRGSLYSLISEQTKNFAGISFKDKHLTLKTQNTYEKTGDFLFTHKGVSGPAVFALSAMSAFDEISNEKPATLKIDFFPDKKFEELQKEILQKCKDNKAEFTSILAEYLPKSLAKKLSPSHKKALETGKKEINRSTEILKNLKLPITDRLTGEEFVTAGGIDTKEIDPKTMESKLVKNLYFTGEVLNIDGFTGGFNLEAAWATGYIAGKSI